MSSHPTDERTATPPLFGAVTPARQPTPQLSGENAQLIEAKAELSRVVAQYGFSVTSQAWEWLVVDHNMMIGDTLVDPSRTLSPPFAFTPPLLSHFYPHTELQTLRLPTPALEAQQHEFQAPESEEPSRYTPVIEFQFSVCADDDDDDRGEGKM